MRETKDQTIERLKRTTEELGKELKANKKAYKTEIKELEAQIEKLEKQINRLSQSQSEKALSNQSEVDRLNRQNRELKAINDDLARLLKEANIWIDNFKKGKKENDWRLLNFMSGFERDKWGQLFFNVDTLITRVNPLNGDFPTSEQETAITDILKNTPQYEEIRKRIEPLKQRIKEEDYEATMLFYSECKKLMESYVNVFFDK